MHGSQHGIYAFVPQASPGETVAEIQERMRGICIRPPSASTLRHQLGRLAQKGDVCRDGRPPRYWRSTRPEDL